MYGDKSDNNRLSAYTGKLRSVYISALLSVAILSVASHAVLGSLENTIANDAIVINTAGMQRSLSQQIASLSAQYAEALGFDSDSTDLSARLRDATAIWQNRYAGLISRDASLGLAGTNSEAIARELDAIGPWHREIDTHVAMLLGDETRTLNPAEIKSRVALIVERANEYLPRMDGIVGLYEAQAIDKVSTLRLTELMLSVLVIAMLVVFGLLIFEPAIRRLARQEHELLGLRTLIDDHTLYSATDARGRIVDVNEGFCRLSGYSREELIGQTHEIVSSGQHSPAFWQDMWQTITGGSSWKGEVCNKRKDGSLYWVLATNIPLTDPNGRLEGYVSLRIDITEKKAAESAVREAHSYLQNLLQAASQFSVIATDLDGTITTFNEGAERMTGYKASEVIGKKTLELFHIEPEIEARGAELSEAAGQPVVGLDVLIWSVGSGGHEARQWTYVRKDGSHLPVVVTVTGIHDDTGRLTGYLGVAQDISARVEARKQAAQQHAEKQAIIDAIPGAVFYKNADNVIVDCNMPAATMLSMAPADVRGKSAADIFAPQEAARQAERDARVLKTGEPILGLMERIAQAPDAVQHMRIDTIPVTGPTGARDHVVVIATDVSDVVNANEKIRSAEERLDAAMRASSTGLWDLDLASGRIYLNDVAYSMLGYAPGELPEDIQVLRDLRHPEDRSRVTRALNAHIDGDSPVYACEYRIRRKNGTYLWIRDAGQIVDRDDNGRPKRFIGVYVSIEELRHALTEAEGFNDELKRTQQRFELAIEGSRDAIFDWDLRTNELYLSPSWESLLGSPTTTIASTLFDLNRHMAPDDALRFRRELVEFVAGCSTKFDSEFRLIDSCGQRSWVMMRAASLRDEQGTAMRVSGSVADITSLKTAQIEMERLVQQDHLTGLASRSRLVKRLDASLESSKRSGTLCGLLLIDFDRFKVVNDSLGHDVGDKLLCSIASRLRENIRDWDTAARFGGDEFVILLEDLATPGDASAVAQKLVTACGEPHEVDGHTLISTASIGFVTSEQTAGSASELLRYADAAMYEAKRRGRCCAVEFDETMYEAQLRRAALEEDLRCAVTGRELKLCFQPVVDLETGAVTSAEALLRWQHPEFGFVRPEEFIAIAEESKQIVDIGDWVIGEVCRQLVDWRERNVVPEDFTVSVNVSKVQLLMPDFKQSMIAHVDRHGLPRGAIKIEVTETTIVDNRSDVGSVLRSLREQSFVIMMDDFGTGHSSLSLLHNLPIDELKIDQSFIKNIDRSKDLAAITSSIITLADHLDLRTIGEGIELPHHVALLQSLGCTYGQGFFWSKPVPASEFEALVLASARRAQALEGSSAAG